MALLSIIIVGTAILLIMDAGCYLWLRANDARRALLVRQLAATAILGQTRQKWLRGSR